MIGFSNSQGQSVSSGTGCLATCGLYSRLTSSSPMPSRVNQAR